ncbi:MAG: DegV family protein [Lachnospiraceae bacterium]|nr:DegV family protein [Lachnospiraceae bacterium]
MSKVAVVTDTNAGIMSEEAAAMGCFVLPMPFMVGEETFYENIDLTQKDFYERLEQGTDFVTSQPSPESVMGLWDNLLKEYDEIVHIPMSSGLSGSYQSASVFAQDYDGKVQVVNNQRISVTMKSSVRDALALANAGKTAAQIKEILEEDKFNSTIYIMLDTLYYLKKGGRITPAAAALGTLLRLKPVLTIQGEKLDAFAKARTVNQGKTLMINAIRNDIVTRFGNDFSPENITLAMAYTKNDDAALVFKKEIEEAFPGLKIQDMDPLSLSISCHIGPGALAVTAVKNLHIS